MLKATNITKSFDTLQILKGIDLEINEKEVVSILGASGAGKTTLLQIISTLEQPDAGSLMINGVEPFKLSSKKLAQFRNEQIGFVFQFHQLLPEFSALENVCMPALIQKQSMTQAQKRAKELLDYLNLSHRFEHKPGALSGGEQQRVAVARALMNQPALILADEPSGNLDTQSAHELHQLFFDLRKSFDQTFIIVTHNNDLARMADRQLVMENGNFIP